MNRSRGRLLPPNDTEVFVVGLRSIDNAVALASECSILQVISSFLLGDIAPIISFVSYDEGLPIVLIHIHDGERDRIGCDERVCNGSRIENIRSAEVNRGDEAHCAATPDENNREYHADSFHVIFLHANVTLQPQRSPARFLPRKNRDGQAVGCKRWLGRYSSPQQLLVELVSAHPMVLEIHLESFSLTVIGDHR